MGVSSRKTAKKEAIGLLKKQSEKIGTPAELGYALNYLTYYGYVPVDLMNNLDEKEIRDAIKEFQKNFGLEQDGVLGPKTLKAMTEPRCGCPDLLDKKNKAHIEFLNMEGIAEEKRDRWNKAGLTYFVSEYVTGTLNKKAQDEIFAAAFKAWDDACGLNITKVNAANKADIIVATGRGPVSNFDGRGGTLAWAYMPKGNDQQLVARFDLDETWVRNPRERGVLLGNVACHEFGHLLGLNHSKKSGALMAPYYNPFVGIPQMDDDIPRIRKLYGDNPKVSALKGLNKIGSNISIAIKKGQKLIVTVS